MCDVYDVLVASTGPADVISTTMCEYGGQSMGGGIRRLASDMLSVGKQIGYEQGMEETYPVAFEEGHMAGWCQGFETGHLEGALKGSLITLLVTGIVGLAGWGIKKCVERKKMKQQTISIVEEAPIEQQHEVECLKEQ